jgi:ferric-dicitrate binding protein FerR (iron transport regulator)
MAEFLVALLPDKSTIVETQHGQVAITETSTGETYTLAEGLRAQIPATATGSSGQKEELSKVIGKVVASAGATRNGKPLPSGESVLEGDLVATGTSGRAVIQLSPTNQLTLNENTSARFTRIVERVWLQLQTGTVMAENKGESYVLVATTRFHIEPKTTEASKIYVGLMTDNSTYIESVAGDVKIEEIPTEQAYLLPAGQNTLVPANASGVPGLQPLQATAAATPAQGAPPSNPQPASAPKGHSHNTIIILGAAAGAGIAATVAALSAGGGGASQPSSPSAP